MSQWNPFQRGFFRETLRHEDHIHNQIEACRQSFNRGDPTEIMYAVESLMLLITPHMEDEDFLSDVEGLESDWKVKQEEADSDYQSRLDLAANGCPDLVKRPSVKPTPEHFKKMFMVACALFERKNLMLKVEQHDTL